jgi:hypothetical protein
MPLIKCTPGDSATPSSGKSTFDNQHPIQGRNRESPRLPFFADCIQAGRPILTTATACWLVSFAPDDVSMSPTTSGGAASQFVA